VNPICPYCRRPIEGNEVPECPDCGQPHHLQCWLENNGCSSVGCSQSPRGRAIPLSVAANLQWGPKGGVATGQAAPVTDVAQYAAKNRSLFMLLGLLLGAFGVHNFYAGYILRGAFQLGLTCATLFYGGILSWCWALVEILVVSRDALERPIE